MAQCATCHNDYDKAFEVVHGGQHYMFDCFECAIHKLAPVCLHCGCRIIGHGIEAVDGCYCCANCAQTAGHPAAQDRVA